MLIGDPTAISFYENSHPLRLFGTLRQLGTLEYCQFRELLEFLIQIFPSQSDPIYYIKWALLKLNRYTL